MVSKAPWKWYGSAKMGGRDGAWPSTWTRIGERVDDTYKFSWGLLFNLS
jgi:hypothetical protein